MKFYLPKSALLFCMSMMLTAFVYGQNKDSVKNAGKNIRICTANRAHALANPPLYVLKMNSKARKEAMLNTFDLQMVKPVWIERIDVSKNDEAISKYGEKGKNGVIIITFKPDSLKKYKEFKKLKFRRV